LTVHEVLRFRHRKLFGQIPETALDATLHSDDWLRHCASSNGETIGIAWPKIDPFHKVNVMVWVPLGRQLIVYKESPSKWSFRSNSNLRNKIPNSTVLSTSTMQRAIIFALIASAFAFPSELLRAGAGETDTCPKTGSHCQNFQPLCCGPVTGFTTCENGKIKFQSCSDGCGEVNGVTKCINDP
jgi:hypothetical protein